MSDTSKQYQGTYQVRQNPLTEFLLGTFSADPAASAPSHLSQQQADLVEILQTYNKNQQDSVLQFVKNYGAPNALPSLDQLSQTKYRDIAEAFGPVAIACLDGMLEEPHKIHTLWHVHHCVEQKPDTMPLLYQFINLCLKLHIFTLEGLLRWNNLPSTIKRVLAAKKMQHELDAYQAGDPNKLHEAIVQMLSPKQNPEPESIHQVHGNWFGLDNKELKTLGIFCASWYEQKCAEDATPNHPQNDKLEIAAAQYLHHISTLPEELIDLLRDLYTATSPDAGIVQVPLPSPLPDISALPEHIQDVVIQTFDSLQPHDNMQNPYAFELLCPGLGRKLLKDLYQNQIIRYITATFSDRIPKQSKSVQALTEKLAHVIGADFVGSDREQRSQKAAERITHPIFAEACLRVWRNNPNTPIHAVTQLASLLNVETTANDMENRRQIARTLFQEMEQGYNFQPEFSEVIAGVLVANAPNSSTDFSETLAENLLQDIAILLQTSKHLQYPPANRVADWENAWRPWAAKHVGELEKFISKSPSTALPEQVADWLDNLKASRASIDRAGGVITSSRCSSFASAAPDADSDSILHAHQAALAH